MDFLKILLLSLSFYISTFAQEDRDPYRLPTDVEVKNYKIDLTLEDNFYETKEFTGAVEITLFIIEDDLQDIILNTRNITYEDGVTITNIDTEGVASSLSLDEVEEYEQLVLRSTTPLNSGNYTLKFPSFTGKLHTDMSGFYLSSYDEEGNDGNDEYVATTQFQPTHARRAFPCFDEPNFKASFDLSITRPDGYTSLSNAAKSNTDGNKDTFATTPKMSTYLLAFIVSKFKNYGDYLTDSEPIPNYDVWCREEALPTAEYAYYISPQIMQKLQALTGTNYLDVEGITEMNQVALPDFSAGAMENWGLVTYRETALLWDEIDSTASYRQRVATVIAHEFAHMWFGNLVTLDWWSYTWLNEGFARYYQYFITAQVETDWELEQQFVIEQLQVIFGSDGVEGNSLNAEASTPQEISNKFTSVSYNKGASVIRMMINFLGEDVYTEGIKNYLSKYPHQNTKPENLYEALKEKIPEGHLRFDLDLIMKSWTEQDGYPVITVSRNASGLILTQERFLLNPESTSNSMWYVPITYTKEADPNFLDTTVTDWLEQNVNELLIENDAKGDDGEEEEERGWVLVNLLETGYYRVNYANELWDELAAALQEGSVDFPAINKAQIVDDALNLARANKLSYTKAFEVTSFLVNETSYYPWYAAFNAFSFLRRRIDSTSKTGEYLTTHISTMMQKLYDSVSFSPNNAEHVNTLKTALALQWACQLDNKDCIEKASDEFDKYGSGAVINPDIRSAVYCSAIREDETGAKWEKLWESYASTKLATEEITILNALGCSRDEAILKGYLQKSIQESSGIRKQDANTVFSSVLAGNPENINVAFSFLQDNLEDIIAYYEGMNAFNAAINSIADRLTTQEQITEFETFLNTQNTVLVAAGVQAESALNTAKANVAWAEAKQDELLEWLDSTYGSAASITMNLTLLVVALVTVFLCF